MTVPEKQKKLKKTQDLNDLAPPEETARVLRQSYGNPLEELARRKAIAQAEGHQKNILFWQAVEVILSPDKKTPETITAPN